jgi:hypothetical protein
MLSSKQACARLGLEPELENAGGLRALIFAGADRRACEAASPAAKHRKIEIDEFVPRKEIDDLYLVRPYYIVPDGKVGHDAYAVIRETIRSMDQVALGRVVNAEIKQTWGCYFLTRVVSQQSSRVWLTEPDRLQSYAPEKCWH